jgi:alpha-tubulin suppressor-like RCC1 family protein
VTPDAAREAGSDGSTRDANRPDGSVADAAPDAAASCVASVHDWYALRTDGKLLVMLADQAKTQIPVLDAATGQPLTNVVQAAGGAAHGCAVSGNGTVSCWREGANANARGQLGNGTTDTNNGPFYRATPVLITAGQSLMNVAELTHGTDANLASCAVTKDGKLWCWGDVSWVASGGAAMNSPYATIITSNGSTPLDSVAQASMSPYFTCAVIRKATRELWCWGSNAHGNVGQTDKMPRRYPTRVMGLGDPSLVRIIGYDEGGNLGGTACAIDGDQVRCWGSNATGVAGVANSTHPILSPTFVVQQNSVPLSGANGLESAPGGGGTFCAHTSANALWCWGNGFMNYAANYGATNAVSQGNFARPSNLVANPRFLTGDGIYHIGSTTVMPNCGAL